ncbi:hypothetical protein OIU74_002700 [Salix koriyanagi]|uniref:Uncharacterized protein n=1 Tax=Salix koriyanagi TaxID=2511006 RepID=A0A9Q1APL0_9ROSI|nr:hypothetical protein OIU74_002700 [Salix koriyanagi]
MSGISRWTVFIDDLQGRYGGLQSVLITSVTPKRSSQEWDRKVEDVDLKWRQLIYNSPADIVKCFSKLRRKRKDEMVVVNWGFILGKLLAQDGAIEQVLSKVKDLEADIMVISEQEANLTSPDLSNRFAQSMLYYSNVFKLLEQEDATFTSWETYFRRQIGNVVACDGIDRVEWMESFDQWKHRLSQAGFRPSPLQAAPSVWKLTDPPQSSSGLCDMQDIVDDSEEMARSFESEDDEENDPCIMADKYLWCTQGSAMNRIAASAKFLTSWNIYVIYTSYQWQ